LVLAEDPLVPLTPQGVVAYNPLDMHHVVACILCGGMDPNADSLLLQAAIAGGITTPWILRSKLIALVARLRGRGVGEPDAASCPLPYASDGDLPTSER
jgi:hypothetical protein